VAERLRNAKFVALFLDFDGTLAPLRRRPQLVWLGEAARRLLRRLSRHPHLRLYIISGRTLADLRERARVPGVRYLGLHGWERDAAESPAMAAPKFLRRAKRVLAKHLNDLPGIRIEDKGFSLAVHYREAGRGAVRRARSIVRETLKPLDAHLRVLEGKKVWEVLPREVEGKGAAVRALLAELPKGTLPVCIGDDTTDESAFAVLRRGITVRVGASQRTKARFFLRNPTEVMSFLQSVEAEIA
jgi:trehalose 6-phosphate phosphatase